jgi:mannose-6-phosphate isomerase-like protein (cupin superfamily)
MDATSKPIIDLHRIGEKLEFADARERTGGRRSEGVVTLAPGRNGPGAHIHLGQVEGFEVLSGTMVLTAGGRTVTLRAGESLEVRSGEAHTFRNGDQGTAVVARFWYEPALNTEWMLQTMGGWAVARGGDWKRVPLLPAAYLLFLLRKEYRLAGMPFWLQDIVFGLLAGIAVITGQVRGLRYPASSREGHSAG